MGQSGNKYIGNFSSKIDDKSRVSIPSKFRKIIGNKNIYISQEFEDTIVLRDEEDFTSWSKFLSNGSTLDKNIRNIQRLILGNTSEVKIDSKGRILLPKRLFEFINKNSEQNIELNIVGMGNKIEIHVKEAWDDINKDFSNKLSKISDDLNSM